MHNYSLICIGSDIYLHNDKNLMPKNPAAWSAWNFLGSKDNKICVTYWLNILQVGKNFHMNALIIREFFVIFNYSQQRIYFLVNIYLLICRIWKKQVYPFL